MELPTWSEDLTSAHGFSFGSGFLNFGGFSQSGALDAKHGG